jgi:hypothetical protein
MSHLPLRDGFRTDSDSASPSDGGQITRAHHFVDVAARESQAFGHFRHSEQYRVGALGRCHGRWPEHLAPDSASKLFDLAEQDREFVMRQAVERSNDIRYVPLDR